MALDTVGDFIAQARVLLQDSTPPYRYPDADLIFALNLAVLESRRLRADLFYPSMNTLPTYTTTADAVAIDPQYRGAFLYYIAGYVGVRDAEEVEEQRAATFMNAFKDRMVTL